VNINLNFLNTDAFCVGRVLLKRALNEYEHPLLATIALKEKRCDPDPKKCGAKRIEQMKNTRDVFNSKTGSGFKDLVRNNFPLWMRVPGALRCCSSSP
jgi:hypothetical protein